MASPIRTWNAAAARRKNIAEFDALVLVLLQFGNPPLRLFTAMNPPCAGPLKFIGSNVITFGGPPAGNDADTKPSAKGRPYILQTPTGLLTYRDTWLFAVIVLPCVLSTIVFCPRGRNVVQYDGIPRFNHHGVLHKRLSVNLLH